MRSQARARGIPRETVVLAMKKMRSHGRKNSKREPRQKEKSVDGRHCGISSKRISRQSTKLALYL